MFAPRVLLVELDSQEDYSFANSMYHALQVRAEREFSNGLQFLLTYTFSKSIDNASATDDSISWLGGGTTDGSTLGVQNPYDLGAERALSVYNIPQVLQFYAPIN